MKLFHKCPLALVGLIVVIALFPREGNAQVKHSDPVRSVQKALAGQVSAWNAGDLEAAMAFYRNSPDMIWISKSGVDKGYQSVLDAYRKDYADRSKMGVYTYEPLHIESLSSACVYYVFKWKIELAGKRLMGGISSQLWKRIDGRWVITSEHAS
jgi:ketosteroid isomerase-like protein